MVDEKYAPYVRTSERIPAEKFLNLSPAQRREIASTRIVPPTLEGNDFGFIDVEHKTQRYDVDAVFA